MQIPVQQLPILDSGQMSPFHQALQSGMANYQNNIKTAFLPAQLQADIASKQTYATYSPYSYIAKALSDPATLAVLLKPENADQLKALAAKLATIPVSQGNQQGQLFQGISHLFNGNNAAPNQSMNQPQTMMGNNNQLPTQAPAAPSNQNADAGYEHDENGNNVKASDAEINHAANQPPAKGAPNDDYFGAHVAKTFPLSDTGIAHDVKKENAKSQIELWNVKNAALGKEVDNAQDSLTTLKELEKLYPKLHYMEKGAVFGHSPHLSSHAQTFDQLAQIQATSNLRALQSGHITNTDFAIGDKLKPNRVMNEDAFKSLAAFNEAKILRVKQKQRFMQEAQDSHMTTQKADTIWSNFIESHPLFNPETEQLIKQNYYMSPFNAKKQSTSPSREGKVESQSSGVPVVEHEGKKYVHLNGRWHPA